MPAPALPQEIAGRYVIERELGRGGAAVVYLARDHQHDRLVAVKVLRPEFAQSIVAERFVQEVRLTATLHHPHIVPVLDSGQIDDLLYFVAPYFDGESLGARLQRERQLPVDDALRIARELADALQHAHDAGIVHRDIKPENVLFAGGHAHLADFGVAFALRRAGGERLTSTGLAVGTPAYMSPEQAAGERALDARSDIYSLACVVYEMLAGVQPFVGPTPESVIAQRFAFAPRSLRAYRGGVPPHVDAAILRALAVAPADRFQSAAEFAAALGVPLHGARSGTGFIVPPPASRFRVSRRTALGAGAVLVLALVGAALARGGVLPVVSFGDAKARGVEAIRSGDADGAQRWLRRVTAPDDASGNLWRAQWELLFGADSSAWRESLQVALSRRDALGPAERERADAMAALADGRYPAACTAFQSLETADVQDAAASLDVATCLTSDAAVVPDAASPSGWRFRSSLHGATQAYLRALDRMTPRSTARPIVYRRLFDMLRVEWGRYYPGVADGDPRVHFAGIPALQRGRRGDTLLLVAYPLAQLATGRPDREVQSTADALEYSANLARDVAERWAREFPRDADAHAAFARMLELRGDIQSPGAGAPSALEEARRARALTAGTSRELDFVVQGVRLRLKLSDFRGAAAMSDSALARFRPTNSDARWTLATLAALTGRARATADLLQGTAAEAEYLLPDGRAYHPRTALATTALRLFAFCAIGAPADSIAVVRDRVDRELETEVPPRSRDSVRTALLGRTLVLAVPVLGPELLNAVPGARAPIARAQRRLASRDAAGARAILDSMQAERAAYLPGALQMDQAYQEAWVRAAASDTAGALRQLAAVLDALPTMGLSLFEDMTRAAALPRAMRLRATLLSKRGDAGGAARWNDAAAALLRDADPELHR